MFGWRMAALLLLLPAGGEAQSGDGGGDGEPRVSCTSHITTEGCSLTCTLLGGTDDDEDNEGIAKMSLCYTDWADAPARRKCLEDFGDTISSKELTPLQGFNLTVHLKRGGEVSTTVDLKKIVKPRSPQVWNVAFEQEVDQAVIRIRTPYHQDYLTLDNQLFQLHIFAAGSSMIQNISSKDFLLIDMEHLHKHTEYHVRVRAIPQKFLRGVWSEWSAACSFFTPAETTAPSRTEGQPMVAYQLIICPVSVVVLISCVVVFWKNRIFAYMWPSIPHPKQTLVQICKPNKGLLLNLKPEVFSALSVDQQEKAEPSDGAATDGLQPSSPCSTQSSDCRSTTSVGTEELELSSLLSRSSSDGEDGLPSTSPSPPPQPERCSGRTELEALAVSQQEEAYVTMSSFYQVK